VTRNARQHALLEKIAEASRAGIDLIQVREKDLSSRKLEALARAAMRVVRENSSELATRLLINSRSDLALACRADGVHLRSEDISPPDVRKIWIEAEILRVRWSASLAIPWLTFAGLRRRALTSLSSLQCLKRRILQQPRLLGSIIYVRLAGRRFPCWRWVALRSKTLSSVLRWAPQGIAAVRLFQENNIADVHAAFERLTTFRFITNCDPDRSEGSRYLLATTIPTSRKGRAETINDRRCARLIKR